MRETVVVLEVGVEGFGDGVSWKRKRRLKKRRRRPPVLLADGNSISSVLLSFFRSPPLTLVELLAVRVHHADLEDVLEDEGRGHLEKVGRREVMKKKKSRLRWAKKFGRRRFCFKETRVTSSRRKFDRLMRVTER